LAIDAREAREARKTFPGRNPGGLYPGGLPKAFQRTSKSLLEDLQKSRRPLRIPKDF
jgi:hypothetical protein